MPDYDQSIHNLWRDRFSRIANKQLDITYFSSGEQFREHCRQKPNQYNVLFLVDFELLNQDRTGLDLIEELDIANQAILVTSHYEDSSIRIRAGKIDLRIIPKGMAAFVPII